MKVLSLLCISVSLDAGFAEAFHQFCQDRMSRGGITALKFEKALLDKVVWLSDSLDYDQGSL